MHSAIEGRLCVPVYSRSLFRWGGGREDMGAMSAPPLSPMSVSTGRRESDQHQEAAAARLTASQSFRVLLFSELARRLAD